jgi:uncharacterized phage protein gp47/JayE
MATLPSKSFTAIVEQIATGIQGRASALINFAIGSTLRALAEGVAGVILWLYTLILQVSLTTRAATSQGADLDSFVNDYGVTRVGAQTATGLLTYSRFSAGSSQPFIPVGASVQSADGTQVATVVASATNPNFSASLNGYTMPLVATSISVPAANIAGGAAGNVSAGSFTVSTTAITGIDAVTNAAAFSNGADAETDTALRARFQTYILGLAKGTAYGLAYAIKSLAVNVFYSLVEFQDYSGAAVPGYFYVVCDDGSGAPSAAFVSAVSGAMASVRPLGVQGAVYATTAVTVNASLTLAIAAGYDRPTLVSAVQTLIGNNIGALDQGAGMDFGHLYSWALSIPGVIGLTGVTLNGLSGDAANIAANPKATLVPGTISVS